MINQTIYILIFGGHGNWYSSSAAGKLGNIGYGYHMHSVWNGIHGNFGCSENKQDKNKSIDEQCLQKTMVHLMKFIYAQMYS